ncbi:MAG: ABC transporter ATP-binding protein [Bacilli bacterium]
MLFGKYVNKFYKKYFWNFFWGILFLIVVDYIQLLVPKIIGNLTDAYDSPSGLTSDFLNMNCLYILLIAIGMLAGRFIWRVAILDGAFKITADLRGELFNKTTELSQNYYHNNKVGSIMSYFTNDLDTITDAYGFGLVMLVDAVFMGILSFINMMMVSWQISLITLIPLIILVISAYFIDNKMEKIYNQRQEAFEKMSDYTQEMFSGLRVIKAFVREIRESIRFSKVNKENQQKDLALVKFSALLDTLISILIEMMFAISLAIGGYIIYNNYLQGIEGFSRGDMFEFIGYLNAIIWPMIALGQIIALRSRAKTSLKRISVVLDEPIDVKDDDKVIPLNDIKGNITFKDFSYRFKDGDTDALKHVNLDIKAGDNIGIIGKIGSGKSILVNCLLRIDTLHKGEVFIDGHDIMNIPIKQIREAISFVPQDNFLFSSTIKDNIGFSDEKLSDEQIEDAAKFADVHDDIKEFIDGYRTLVGERGVTLSGGQKQRISIARAYAKHAPIMIMDDSVSAVDVKTEEMILKNLKANRKGQTTLIVASRVSTVEHLDKIIVMNNGEVEAFGSPKELLKISPTYQRMAHLQELENEVGGNE